MPGASQRLITGYVPKVALSYTAVVLWGILAIVLWTQLWKHGRRYMLCLCITMTTMVIGFGIRIMLTNQPGSLGIYVGTTLFTLLSPCGFIATSYIVLPRLATWLDAEDYLFLRASRIVRLFVWSDVITFFLQAGGSGLTVMTGTMGKVGAYVCVAGLVLQLASFSTFMSLLLVWGYRLRKNQPFKWSTSTGKALQDWRAIYYALIWSGVGILIRSVFRTVEYAQGYDGELRTTEVYFYVLDALPLFLGMIVWAVIWPPAILNQDAPYIPSTGYSMPVLGAGATPAKEQLDWCEKV